MKKMLLMIVLMMVSLANATRAQNISPAMQKLLDAKDDKRCQSIGAKLKSEAYVTCRLQMMQMRQQTFVPTDPALTQQPSIIYAPQPYVVPKPYLLPSPTHMQLPRQTNCTSEVIGQQVYTNCQQN
jgi:hypothetical protein